MKLEQYFFVNGQFYGAVERQLERVHETLAVPRSLALCCDYCGSNWAQFPVEAVPGGMQKWMFLCSSCEKCSGKVRSMYEWPGCCLTGAFPELIEVFPEALLKREFEQHFKMYQLLKDLK